MQLGNCRTAALLAAFGLAGEIKKILIFTNNNPFLPLDVAANLDVQGGG